MYLLFGSDRRLKVWTKLPTKLALLFTLLIVTASPSLCFGEIVEYVEDFLTQNFSDPTFTTAVWDTLSGQLYLAPQEVTQIGGLDVGGSAYASVKSGNFLLVANDSGGLVSIDVSDPEAPSDADQAGTLGVARSITLVQNWAYMAIGAGGLQTFNVTDPENLVAGGSADVAGFSTGVAVKDSWTYLAQSNSGIAVINSSDPSDPLFASNVATNDWARNLTVSNNLLLVADSGAGMAVFNISTPATPQLVGQLDTDGACFGVTVEGNHAYLADGANGLVIADISNPAAPQEIGHLGLTGFCYSVAAAGDTLFVAAGDEGLYMVDISDPADPELTSQFDPGSAGYIYHTNLAETLLFVSGGTDGVRILEADPQGLNQQDNVVRSININTTSEPVSRARLASVYTDSIKFEISIDGGSLWHHLQPDDQWLTFETPGTDLRWRTTLVQTGPFPGPVCSNLQLTFDRLHSFAEIESAEDVPDDAGGQVRLSWSASRFDVADSDETVTEYSIYRRYDNKSEPAKKIDDTKYPDGNWDYLTTIPADQEATYSAVLPTLNDYTIADGCFWSVFFIRTRTAVQGVFYDSPPDSACSVNNQQPDPPYNFAVDHNHAQGAMLTWQNTFFPDFAHFLLYRSLVPGAGPLPANLFEVTVESQYLDTSGQFWHYTLTVVNSSGYESEPARQITDVPGQGTNLAADQVKLSSIYPNPFNPVTAIEFLVPTSGHSISLKIYNSRGALVSVLEDGYLPGGTYERSWNGKDLAGKDVASGLYYCQLVCGKQIVNRKMTLVR